MHIYREIDLKFRYDQRLQLLLRDVSALQLVQQSDATAETKPTVQMCVVDVLLPVAGEVSNYVPSGGGCVRLHYGLNHAVNIRHGRIVSKTLIIVVEMKHSRHQPVLCHWKR